MNAREESVAPVDACEYTHACINVCVNMHVCRCTLEYRRQRARVTTARAPWREHVACVPRLRGSASPFRARCCHSSQNQVVLTLQARTSPEAGRDGVRGGVPASTDGACVTSGEDVARSRAGRRS